jgi:hypothetical protein
MTERKLLGIYRFRQEIVRTVLYCSHGRFDVSIGGKKNDWQRRAEFTQPSL